MKKIRPKALLKVPLRLDFETGRVEKQLYEVLGFKKGMILKLENSKENVIRVLVNDKLYAEGKTLQKKGELFIQIVELLNNREGY